MRQISCLTFLALYQLLKKYHLYEFARSRGYLCAFFFAFSTQAVTRGISSLYFSRQLESYCDTWSMAIEILHFLSVPEFLFAFSIIFLKTNSDWLSDISKLDDLVVISLFQQINYGHQPFSWTRIIRKPSRFESQSERTPYD